MQLHRFTAFIVVAALIALTACSGGQKKATATPPPTIAAVRSPAPAAAHTPTPAVTQRGATLPARATPTVGRSAPPAVPTPAIGRGAPVVVTPAGGRATPARAATAAADCTQGAVPEAGANEAFNPGTPVPRPAIDLSVLTVAQQDVPAGFTPLGQGGFTQAERVTADDLARGTEDPQAAADYLNTIGFLGGRQQGWNGTPSQGYVPTLYVQHLVFSSDAGATSFMNNPVIPPSVCFQEESGPAIGQEASYLTFQFSQPLTSGGTGMAEGHAIVWRCGRIVINVSGAGAPGTVTQGTLAQFAQKVQAAFVKIQPCS